MKYSLERGFHQDYFCLSGEFSVQKRGMENNENQVILSHSLDIVLLLSAPYIGWNWTWFWRMEKRIISAVFVSTRTA